MDSMEQINRQISIEEGYNRKHIDAKIRDEIMSNPDLTDKIVLGVQLITEYMQKDYYASKNARISQLKNLGLEALVMDIFIGVAYCQKPELFTSVTAQMAGRLNFSNKAEAITTIAEIMAVLCNTDAFDIIKESPMASLMIQSRIPLSNDLIRFILQSQYLPPMVCTPLELVNNYSNGYLTYNDSLILGTGNHHDGDICLDVLNLMNQVPLKLDTDFLSTVEEEPTFDLDTPEKREAWDTFKRQSYEFYLLIAQYGNELHLTHKVDKRGRIYAQGYHINTQGTSFKKAMVELAKEEVVTGI